MCPWSSQWLCCLVLMMNNTLGTVCIPFSSDLLDEQMYPGLPGSGLGYDPQLLLTNQA